tara:strand:- start:165 stop:266 length:102 start_codon:yes stop_codon:yes gene_type:complete
MWEIISAALALSALVFCLSVIMANVMYPMGRKK